MYTKFAMSLCLFHLGNPPRGRILQVCRLLPDDWQVPLLLHAHHCFIQAFLQRSELQTQLPGPLVGKLVRLRHRLAVVFTPIHQHTYEIFTSQRQRIHAGTQLARHGSIAWQHHRIEAYT